MNEGGFLDECFYWTDWSCGLYVSVFSVIAIVTHFCEAISAIWSFYFESWNHYLNLYFLFTPKCFRPGNGATRNGAKQFEPSHSTNGSITLFLDFWLFFSLLFKFTDNHYLKKKVFFYEKASHTHVESRLHVEIT